MKPTFLPENHLTKGSVSIYPDYTSHARLLFVQKDESGGLHDNYGFALRRNRASAEAATTNTSSQLNVRDRPARTFVLPAPVPDGHTICRDPENRGQTSAPDHTGYTIESTFATVRTGRR